MKTEKLPAGARRLSGFPQMYESGFLYFEVEPWSQAARVYLKIPSKATLRAVRYWLDRIADWHDTGCVTHLTGIARARRWWRVTNAGGTRCGS